MAMNSTEVQEELQLRAEYFDSFCSAAEERASAMEPAAITAILNSLSIKPPHREAVVVKETSRRRPRFFYDPAVYAAISGGLPRLSLTRSTAAQSSSIPGALPELARALLASFDYQNDVRGHAGASSSEDAGPSSAGADADGTSYEGAVETTPFPTNALALLGLDVIPRTEDEWEQILANVEPSASVEQAKQEICAYLRAMQQIINRTATRPGKRRHGN
ncbi:hypothetical protein AB1Y20_017000 [Prymnesium parvum]|uniref:Uncharacterized protein n=1 Tax=Prymnesium parvum TaxID=97485 RepID=A0AB34IB62_PRYPA